MSAGLENPPAFLTTTLTHICLDQLRSARRKREEYPGVWLPEPVPDTVGATATETTDPQQQLQLQRLESVSLAFLALLESLNPHKLERMAAAFGMRTASMAS